MGGQKWFHVYDNEKIPPDDLLFWTRPSMNWNYMCSECHSTHVRKNYNSSTKKYNTQWTEIDVSCEACHGPGSAHEQWAQAKEEGSDLSSYKNMGLVINLKDKDNGRWIFDPDSTTARRSVERKGDELVQMCARCHSRRSVITEDYTFGGSLLQTHWPSLLDEGLYFADGQIQDEVYVYGSFLQSKMHAAGVVCKDCHEPHSSKLLVEGNGLCYRCHLVGEYGTKEHHFHKSESPGAACVECHMPERTYMVVDPRRDHSIRIPRPDLSDKLEAPNACNKCHKDQTNEWSAKFLEQWYGKDLIDKNHFGEIFWAARRSDPSALKGLVKLIQDKNQAPIIRASAISLLNHYFDPGLMEVWEKSIKDPEALVRYASLTNYQFTNSPDGLALVLECLNDPVKLVRIMAAYSLAGIDKSQIPGHQISSWEKAIEEYKSSLMINSDHPSGQVNIGNLYLNLGDPALAEASYQKAVNIEPKLVSPYINLADLYRRQQRDEEGKTVLEKALSQNPDEPSVHYSLGLLYIREGEQEKAMGYLEKAAQLAPAEARYQYVYGIGLNSMGRSDEALVILISALNKNPFNRDILFALATINNDLGNRSQAEFFTRKLLEYYPADPEIIRLGNTLLNTN